MPHIYPLKRVIFTMTKEREFKRMAYLPRTIEGDGPRSTSKFSGTPWLPRGESWPSCKNCNQALQLFVQLNLSELPNREKKRLGKKGLIQLFYCTNDEPLCEVDCEAFFPFAESVLARFIDSFDDATVEAPTGPENPFPAFQITGWDSLEDFPNYEEQRELLGPQEEETENWDDFDGHPEPVAGDKLGGWPFWVQGVEYPNCPECDETMELIFQIDSEDHLPFMFGDLGTGHLTRCPKHPHVLAFGWACS